MEERNLMIQTLVSRGIVDKDVLRAMEEVPREKFVNKYFLESAYADKPLPIACDQTISQPYIVAYMCQLACLSPQSIVLDIGTGSGYAAAVLSRIVKKVYTVERFELLFERASIVFQEIGYSNIVCSLGDGIEKGKKYAPYDAIVVAAATEELPLSLIEQLKVGGRLIIPLGSSEEQRLFRFTKRESGYKKEILDYVRFVPLIEKDD